MLKKLLGLVFLTLLLITSVSALSVRTGDDIYILPDETINDNLLVAGGTVKVAGNVNGDLLVFGGKVVIQGAVKGNIIAAGGNLLITGQAKNMYIVGGDVAINGVVSNDLLAGCGDLYIGKEARIGRDVYLGCGSARIAGKIYRDLKAGVGDLILLPTVLVKGSFDYSADNVNLSDKARVLGSTKAYDMPDYGNRVSGYLEKFSITRQVLSFLAILIMGILIVVFLPKQVELINGYMRTKFWQSLGWGILTLIVVPLAIILLFITVLGIPLGLLLTIAYIFGLYLHGVFSGVIIGKWFLDKLRGSALSLIWALALGLVIIRSIDFIPVVGWWIKFVLLLWSFGAIAATRYETYLKAREKEVL